MSRQQWEQELVFLREMGQRNYHKRANFKGGRSNNLILHNTSLCWHSPWFLNLNSAERIRILKTKSLEFPLPISNCALLEAINIYKCVTGYNINASGKNHHVFFPLPSLHIYPVLQDFLSFPVFKNLSRASNIESLFAHPSPKLVFKQLVQRNC